MPKSAQAKGLDLAAKHIYKAGTKVAGKTGGKAADALANLLLAPIRRRTR